MKSVTTDVLHLLHNVEQLYYNTHFFKYLSELQEYVTYLTYNRKYFSAWAFARKNSLLNMSEIENI